MVSGLRVHSYLMANSAKETERENIFEATRVGILYENEVGSDVLRLADGLHCHRHSETLKCKLLSTGGCKAESLTKLSRVIFHGTIIIMI